MVAFFIGIIKIYQYIPGPWHNACRHTPTCSNYAIESLREFGLFKGSFLSIKRILKCNPWGSMGYDPVPKKGKSMKKILIILCLLLLSSGCSIASNNMENIIIYTTTYPIEYITNELYKDHSRVFSIYPNEIIELSDKLLTDYSKSDLFVYNSLSEERNYAVDMINKNQSLMIVDAAMGMKYTYGIEELWINPSNFLMLSQNIKEGFKEYITSSYLINEIDDNYDELKLKVSEIDAEMKLMVENAPSKNLLVSNDIFSFLEKYGLSITSLDPDTELLDKRTSTAENLINNGTIKYILVLNDEKLDESIENFITKKKITKIYYHSLTTITDEEESSKDYISLMYNNIDTIKKELYE